MRLYRVVLRSGAKMDIMAKSMCDDPARSDSIDFFHDESGHTLAATVKRDQVVGLIFHLSKSSALPYR